jgi:type 1 glutamine amidotransferase
VVRKRDMDWITYKGSGGPGSGKSIVFVSGDEEYRSEEGLPMLAKILSQNHGFNCTVLFSINDETGEIDPETVDNIPGLRSLKDADLMVMLLRFRELPDEQMAHIIDFIDAGKPVIALRTSTHAFKYLKDTESPFAKYDCENKDPSFLGGFGRQILGEAWVGHHGEHGVEGTRGLIDSQLANHPVLKGVSDIWAPTDVYAVGELQGNSSVLVWGQVISSLEPSDKPNSSKTVMPVAWLNEYPAGEKSASTVLATTMGASVDLVNEGLRRLLINGCYWLTGLENEIEIESNATIVGEYQPTFYGFGTHTRGVYPSDHSL